MKSIIAANWKMNGRLDAVQAWFQQFANILASESALDVLSDESLDVVLSLPATLIHPAQGQISKLSLNQYIQLAAQDVSVFGEDGAYTGEISAQMLKDVGCNYAIIGHSERRHLMKDSSSLCAEKCEKAIQAGVKPIFCVGETEAERQEGQTWSVIEAQLGPIKSLLESSSESFVVAYEPVWAIGTGQHATADQIGTVHQQLHEYLGAVAAKHCSGQMPVIYGGSLKPANANEIFQVNTVNGGLIGGASLQADSFLAIVSAFCRTRQLGQ